MSKIVWIFNLSPESFSDGKQYTNKEIHQKIEELISDGADIIDIGAESTAPGSTPINAEEELRRLNFIFSIIKEYNIPFSLDTTKSEVAKIWIDHGVSIINDVSGGRTDGDMMPLIAAHINIEYVMMYCKNPSGRANHERIIYPKGIVNHIIDYFHERVVEAQCHGIRTKQLILDPGMGAFVSSDYHDSVQILQHIDTFKKEFDLPVFIGTSKKWFLKNISPDQGPNDRVWSSLTSSLYAMRQWADYIRVHDVRRMRQALDTWNVLNYQPKKSSFWG